MIRNLFFFFFFLPLKGGSSIYGTKPQNKGKLMILSSLAYITLIRLSFCISTGERESQTEGGRERENFRKKKKKKKNWSEMILQSSK